MKMPNKLQNMTEELIKLFHLFSQLFHQNWKCWHITHEVFKLEPQYFNP